MLSDVIVLASGPSVAEYDLRDLEHHGYLIAINASALYTKPNAAFTMDRKVAEYCLPLWKIQGIPKIHLRECILKNIKPTAETKLFQRLDESVHLVSTPGKLNGSNSGTCALNLAYQQKPFRIFLLGFDMQRGERGEPYWHPPYPWNPDGAAKNTRLANWAAEFEELAREFAAAKIEVYNVNHRSKITAFRKISYNEFLHNT